jgi:predicted permease
LIQDIRYSVRILLKSPGFSIAAILTLALTIGATVAMFTVVHAVLLRQLPFKDPDRLVWVWSRQTGRDKAPFNVPDFIDLRDRNGTLDGLAGIAAWSVNLLQGGDAERIQGVRVSANLFALLGVDAAMGRTLVPDDDRPGASRVVVLTDGLWRRRFGGDRAVLGGTLTLDGAGYTVVGVLPPQFFFPVRDAELAAPLAPDVHPLRSVRNSVSFLRAVARLKPTVSRSRAEEELTAVAKQLQREHPDANARKAGATVVPIAEEIVGSFRAALLALMAAVGGVLLIACANLASLTLARGSARRKEMAIRLASGATRARLVRQLLTESALLGAIGGVFGILLAGWGIALLVTLAPADLPRLKEIRLDRAVLAFTLGISWLSSLLFGIVPALLASRTNVTEEMKDGGRGSSEGKARRRARTVLVMVEVALALVLLIVVGLFGRSFANIQSVRPGFDSERVLAARLSLPRPRYDSRERITGFQRELLMRVARLPGVQSAGAISILPLSGLIARIPFTVGGRPVPRAEVPSAQYRLVTEGYFQTMGVPLRRGRAFGERDTATTPPVVIVSETLARRFFGGREPIGERLLLHDTDTAPRPAEIVGVVGDVKHLGLDADPTPDVYVPYSQLHTDVIALAAANMFWVVRTENEPRGLAALVRYEMQQVDPEVPIGTLRTMDQYLSASVAPRRFNVSVLGAFAVAAVLLAATGIYAMLSYSISQRAHEIAIRAALGAQRRDILALVVGQGLRPAMIGVGAGLAAALAVTRALSGLLFGLSPTDPATFIAVSIGLFAVALTACIVPGVRAAKAALAGSSRIS